MSSDEVKELYSVNQDVKNYIDRFAANRHKPVEDCFGDAIVRIVVQDYKEKEESKHGKETGGVRELVPEVQVCDKR